MVLGMHSMHHKERLGCIICATERDCIANVVAGHFPKKWYEVFLHTHSRSREDTVSVFITNLELLTL